MHGYDIWMRAFVLEVAAYRTCDQLLFKPQDGTTRKLELITYCAFQIEHVFHPDAFFWSGVEGPKGTKLRYPSVIDMVFKGHRELEK